MSECPMRSHSHTHSSCYLSRWLIFCQVVLLRLFRYGNENANGYDEHLRSQTELLKVRILPSKFCVLTANRCYTSQYP